jgi:hypothetical protein
VSDDVKERFIAALDDGDLDPSRFHDATSSWPVCNVACTGRVKTATSTLLTLEAMVDGREWTIGLSPQTQIYRKGVISVSDLRQGEFLRVSSQDGVTAQFILSFAH